MALPNVMGAIGATAKRGGKLIVPLLLVVSVAAVFLVMRLRVETNLIAMFPRDDATIQDFRYFSSNFGLADSLVIVVDPDTPSVDEKTAGLEAWLRESPRFTFVMRAAAPDGIRGRMLLAFPARSSLDQPFCLAMMGEVNGFLAANGIKARVGGPPAVVAESTSSMQRDLLRTGAIATVIVLAILAVSLGDVLFSLIALVPVGAGILWCMAFAVAAFGRVNFITAALPTTLIGMGVDYALHLRTARLEFPQSASSDVWRNVYMRVGTPLLISMLTSCAAFLALGSARMSALREMGIVGAFGLAAVFLLCMAMMPALQSARDRLRETGTPISIAWLGRTVAWVVHHRVKTILLFAAASGVMLAFALRVRISADPMDYINNELPSIALRNEMVCNGNIAIEPILVAVADREAEERLLAHIAPLIGKGKPFARVNSFTRTPLLRFFKRARNPFAGKDGSLCVILYPSFNPYIDDNPARLSALMDDVRGLGGADIKHIAGTPIMLVRLLALIGEDMARVSVAASIVVIAILALLVRTPRFLFPVLLPLAGGVVWMLGMLVVFGQKLTALNVVSMPLVVGLGIDYGVHIVHRLRHDTVENAVTHTGRPIIVASLTTAVAFFALCFSRDPGLRSMGLTSGTGIVACLIWSLFFLPALLRGREDTFEETADEI